MTSARVRLFVPEIGHIYDSEGNRVSGTQLSGYDRVRTFVPSESGAYYVQVSGSVLQDFYEQDLYGLVSVYGTYTVSLRRVGQVVDDYSADTSTTGAVTVGGSVTGEVERSGLTSLAITERDWFAVDLDAGQQYRFDLEGSATGRGTLYDPKIWGVYDANGVRVPGTTIDGGGVTHNSRLEFTPDTTGVYYVSAGTSESAGHYQEHYVGIDAQDSYVGTYTLSVSLSYDDDYEADRSTTGAAGRGRLCHRTDRE